jgi:hypothetical protein
MNTEQISKPAPTTSGTEFSQTISLDELAASGTAMGTFADKTDFVVRIRNGKPIAANTGDQGGGQN